MEETQNTRKRKIWGYIGLAIGCGCIILFQYLLFRPSEFDQQLTAEAREINKKCSMMLSEEIRMDNVMAVPGNEFQYHYTYFLKEQGSIDTLSVQKQAKPHMTEELRTSPNLGYFRDHRVRIVHIFKDTGGKYLFMIAIEGDEYAG